MRKRQKTDDKRLHILLRKKAHDAMCDIQKYYTEIDDEFTNKEETVNRSLIEHRNYLKKRGKLTPKKS